MFNALFVLEIFKFLSWLFGYVEKQLDKKAMANFKIYNIKNWARNNCNTHIAQIARSNQTIKSGQSVEYNMRNIFFEKSYTKWGGETIRRPF